MGDTTIEWTDHSINPIRARLRDAAHAGLVKGGYDSGVGHYCEKISSGCALCYASATQRRFGMPAFPGVSMGPAPAEGDNFAVPVNDQVEVFFDASKLQEVLSRKKPTKYFWCDMTDLFGRWVPDDWIDRCFAVMALTPWHTHQVLTKRADRMAEYFTAPVPLSSREELVVGMAPRQVEGKPFAWGEPTGRMNIGKQADPYTRRRWPGWPLPNVWLGVSVENQPTADERISHLLRCPAAVRFLSVEPLLGAVDFRQQWVKDLDGTGYEGVFDDRRTCLDGSPGIDWVIVGGESGLGARPMHPAWVRSLRDQCGAVGVPFFFKQWGAWKPADECTPERRTLIYQGESGQRPYVGPEEPEWHDWPDGWASAKVGKKAAGRLLDGREWNEMPKAGAAS